jgi:hypothetical protein
MGRRGGDVPAVARLQATTVLTEAADPATDTMQPSWAWEHDGGEVGHRLALEMPR